MSAQASGFVIRAMREGDLERVLAIASALPSAPQWTREAYAAAIGLSGSLRRIAIVAEDTNVVVGFAVSKILPPEAELESIAVAPEQQCAGIGTGLLRAMIRAVKQAGGEELILEVRDSNGPAISLYTRTGFAGTGRRSGYYVNPAEDAVLMRIALPREQYSCALPVLPRTSPKPKLSAGDG